MSSFVRRLMLAVIASAAAVQGIGIDAATSPVTSLSGYEYIIVGSGAGGGVLAARLATYGHSVLLLEAGDQSDNVNHTVPVYHAYSTEDEATSWAFYVKHFSDPARAARDQKMTYDLPNGQLYVGTNPPAGARMRGVFYPRASALGGSSLHNAMINIYPSRVEWDAIADLTDDESWRADRMRKLYQRMERCQDTTCYARPGHGYDGWLGVKPADLSVAITDTKLLRAGLAAAAALGTSLPTTIINGAANLVRILAGDMNADSLLRDKTEAVYQIPLATSGGYRVSARTFLASTVAAVNADGSKKYKLDIRLNTLVTRVLFDSSSPEGARPRATGVEFLQGRKLYKVSAGASGNEQGVLGTATATKEVILAGGAFNTPQMLKLSGIGPRSELERLNIPVKVDLPGVGGNLQDHFEIGVTGTSKQVFSSVADCTFGPGDPTDPCFQQWQRSKSGPYATSNGFAYTIMKRTSVIPTANSAADLMIFGGLGNFRGYFPGYAAKGYTGSAFTWVVLRPFTQNRAGTVNLTSTNPRDSPDINFRFFEDGDTANGEDKQDIQAMAEGVGLARKIINSLLPLAPLVEGVPVLTESEPGEDITPGAKLDEYIRSNAWSHHASCSCPIGADGDAMAVLDSKFRVRGVDGLRVVDASVFPRVPGYFIVVPTYMIAEKAADVISGRE